MNANVPKPRGRPKLSWDPFEAELDRRFKSGEALEEVEPESRWLAEWAAKQGLMVPGSKPLQHERIRQRINKRFGGAEGYKQTRLFHRMTLPGSEGVP
jgi:hypothetical protein